MQTAASMLGSHHWQRASQGMLSVRRAHSNQCMQG